MLALDALCLLAVLQDAMARVAGLGKPDVFLTLTCNAAWPEIVSSLLPGQTAVDRPDIVARVFMQKLKLTMHLILEKAVLGKVIAHVGTIEFQKSSRSRPVDQNGTKTSS